MRAAATNFGECLEPHYIFFLAKIFGPLVNPFKVKKGRISKKLTILTEKNSLPFFFRASSVTIIAMKNLKKHSKALETLFHDHAIRFWLKSIVYATQVIKVGRKTHF